MKAFSRFGFAVLVGFVLALGAFAEAIDWTKADEVQTGVRLVRRDFTEPRLMKTAVMRIDLRTPGLRFTGTHRDEKWGEPMPDYTNGVKLIRTRRVRTQDFMLAERAKGRDMIVAFNSAPWSPWCSPYTHKYGDPHCLNITEGVVISDHNRKQNHLFVAWDDGRCEITESIPTNSYAKVQVAHAGFDIIMKGGKAVGPKGPKMSLNPCIAYGLSSDGRYMYVITVDGRQPGWSLGADMNDLRSMMTDAGAADAVNMDGGGSTTMLYWNGTEPVMVNRHDPDRKSRRNNGTNMGIYIQRK